MTMRRVQIQKRPRPQVTALQGGWKPIAELTTKVVASPLSRAERDELEQRRRLYSMIQEHATA
jgi:hypothetical protein